MRWHRFRLASVVLVCLFCIGFLAVYLPHSGKVVAQTRPAVINLEGLWTINHEPIPGGAKKDGTSYDNCLDYLSIPLEIDFLKKPYAGGGCEERCYIALGHDNKYYESNLSAHKFLPQYTEFTILTLQQTRDHKTDTTFSLGIYNARVFGMSILYSSVPGGVTNNSIKGEVVCSTMWGKVSTSFTMTRGDSTQNNKTSPIHAFFINGILNTEADYNQMKPQITKLVTEANDNQPITMESLGYNHSTINEFKVILLSLVDTVKNIGNHICPLSQSAVEVVDQYLEQWLGKWIHYRTKEGEKLPSDIIERIKGIEQQEKQFSISQVKPQPKSRFVIVAHSQGTMFAEEIYNKLKQSNKSLADRTFLLLISPFAKKSFFITDTSDRSNITYVLREDDFPTFLPNLAPKNLSSFSKSEDYATRMMKIIENYVKTQDDFTDFEVVFHTSCLAVEHTWHKVLNAFNSHNLNHYVLPEASPEKLKTEESYKLAVNNLKYLLKSAPDFGNYSN
jgi:hypothetical protein